MLRGLKGYHWFKDQSHFPFQLYLVGCQKMSHSIRKDLLGGPFGISVVKAESEAEEAGLGGTSISSFHYLLIYF